MEIPRRICKDLRREIDEPQVLILTGPRQVGKTTLMRRLELDAREAGKRTRYLDLEQPADLASLAGDSAAVIEALTRDVDIVFGTSSTISPPPGDSSRPSTTAALAKDAG